MGKTGPLQTHLFLKIGSIGVLFLCACSSLVQKDPLHKRITPEDKKTLTSLVNRPESSFTPHSLKKESALQNPPSLFRKRISLTIYENVDINEVFSQMSHLLKIHIHVREPIEEKVFYSAHQHPFIDVVGDLCALTKRRFSYEAGHLVIEKNAPYNQTYSVQFLNLIRNTNNQMVVNTDVFGSSQESGSTPQGASKSSVNVSHKSDFWEELDNVLKTITSQSYSNQTATYSLHKQAGVICVQGLLEHHTQVTRYLEAIKKTTSTQVLIEAKIIEVVLRDGFKSGINWEKIRNAGHITYKGRLADLAKKSEFDPPSSVGDMVAFGLLGDKIGGQRGFEIIIQALQEFGSQRTLASPRVTVMNNQSATLRVGQTKVYFKLNYSKQFITTDKNTPVEDMNVSSDIKTVPVGLILSVQPSIDPLTGDIILFLKPTISRLSGYVSDPSVSLMSHRGTNPVASYVPVIDVREIDSILRVRSGELSILGGLMDARSNETMHKIPLLGDIPIAQDLFKSTNEGNELVELVILLRATIIKEGGAKPDGADERLYTFIEDPRI